MFLVQLIEVVPAHKRTRFFFGVIHVIVGFEILAVMCKNWYCILKGAKGKIISESSIIILLRSYYFKVFHNILEPHEKLVC
jgi:hypothetical protein